MPDRAVVERVANALLNSRGGRNGMPPIENALDIVPDEYRAAAIADAEAALAACGQAELLAALKFAQAILEEHIASDCDICGGEGGSEGEGQDFRLTPVRHKDGCEYLTVTAAIAKGEGRS